MTDLWTFPMAILFTSTTIIPVGKYNYSYKFIRRCYGKNDLNFI